MGNRGNGSTGNLLQFCLAISLLLLLVGVLGCTLEDNPALQHALLGSARPLLAGSWAR